MRELLRSKLGQIGIDPKIVALDTPLAVLMVLSEKGKEAGFLRSVQRYINLQSTEGGGDSHNLSKIAGIVPAYEARLHKIRY